MNGQESPSRTQTSRTRSRSRLRSTILCAVGLLGVTACTEWPSPIGPQQNADVAGTWDFTYGGSIVTVRATLELTQDGNRVRGRFIELSIFRSFCSQYSGCYSSLERIAEGPVEGTVSGDRVTLRFQTDPDDEVQTFEGTVAELQMNGERWRAKRGIVAPPAPEPPAPASHLRATPLPAEMAALLDWRDNSNDEDGFVVVEDCGTGSWKVIGVVPANQTREKLVGFEPGVRCTFAIGAYRQVDGEYLFAKLSNVVAVQMQ